MRHEPLAPRRAHSVRMRALLTAAVLLLGCSGSDSPTAPAPPPGALRFSQITAGYMHTCGLAIGGSAFCWGTNDFGTLGDDTHVMRTAPVSVSGPPFDMIEAGAGHTCALNGTRAWCWGHNDEGQLGDGTFLPRPRPVPVAGGHDFVAVSAGHAHSCGLEADGTAWCWGDDSRGQLGDGPGGARAPAPVQVRSSVPFARVIAGYYASCALDTAGAAWCWGRNLEGQLGDGSTVQRDEPVRVQGGLTFTALDVGDLVTCGVSDGQAWCWGLNRHGVLGAEAAGQSAVPVRVRDATSLRSIVVAVGSNTVRIAEPFVCGVRSGAAPLCWGGAAREVRMRSPTPEPLQPPVHFTQVTAGMLHVCALTREGHAYCGGGNSEGQLGDGTQTDRTTLTAVHGPPR